MFVDRSTPEYQALAEQRALHRAFGPQDYHEVKWIDDLFARLMQLPGSHYTDADRANIVKAQEMLDRLSVKYLRKYRTDQARAPAGSADGGQWINEGHEGDKPKHPRGSGGMLHDLFGVRDAYAEEMPTRPRKPQTQNAPSSTSPTQHPSPHAYPRSTNPSPVKKIQIHSPSDLTIHYNNGSAERRTGGSRAWRNNNPGNMVHSDFATRHGAIGNNHGMAVFPDAATGNAADRALLKAPSYSHRTLDEAIHRRSPPNENNTTSLQKGISKRARLDRNRTLDSLSPKEFDRFVEAVHHFEGWQEGKVEVTQPKKN